MSPMTYEQGPQTSYQTTEIIQADTYHVYYETITISVFFFTTVGNALSRNALRGSVRRTKKKRR
jgi:hypothetical protein